MKKADIEPFMAKLAQAHPDPKSELNWTTPYELLVAVVLSAQSTDKGVNVATGRLFPVANTPEAIAALGVEGLTPFIRTIGLYRNKARHIIALSEILRDRYSGTVPDDFDALVALPGVGRKTANVVLNVAFHRPTIPVDTHIFRVANRTGLAPGKKPEEVEARLLEVVPEAYKLNAHHVLLLHGRYCCRARSPQCEACPVAEYCASEDKKARLGALGLTDGAMVPGS